MPRATLSEVTAWGVWFHYPAYAAAATASVQLFALTAIQPFWLEHEKQLPGRVWLAVWFAILNLSRVCANLAAPSRRAVLWLNAASLLVHVVGVALLLADCCNGIWLFSLGGLVDPMATALTRLREDEPNFADPDEMVRISTAIFSAHCVGLLIASSGGTLLEITSPAGLGAVAIVGNVYALLASLNFYCRHSNKKPLKGGDSKASLVGLCVQQPSFLPTLTAIVDGDEAAPFSPKALARAEKLLRQDDKGSISPPVAAATALMRGVAPSLVMRRMASGSYARPSGVLDEDLALPGSRLLELVTGLALGCGAIDATHQTTAALYWEDALRLSPWSLFAVFGVAFGVSAFQPWRKVWLTPEAVVVALVLSAALFTFLVAAWREAVAASVVFCAFTLATNLPHCTILRVLNSYATNARAYARLVSQERAVYAVGLTSGGLAAPALYLATNAGGLFVFASILCSTVAAASAWIYISNAGRAGAHQFLYSLDLENQVEALRSTDSPRKKHHPQEQDAKVETVDDEEYDEYPVRDELTGNEQDPADNSPAVEAVGPRSVVEFRVIEEEEEDEEGSDGTGTTQIQDDAKAAAAAAAVINTKAPPAAMVGIFEPTDDELGTRLEVIKKPPGLGKQQAEDAKDAVLP